MAVSPFRQARPKIDAQFSSDANTSGPQIGPDAMHEFATSLVVPAAKKDLAKFYGACRNDPRQGLRQTIHSLPSEPQRVRYPFPATLPPCA